MESEQATTPETLDVKETDSDFMCFVKAKDNGEVTFTLRAQDITADLLVDLWAMIQYQMRERIRVNHENPHDAVNSLRTSYGMLLPMLLEGDRKILQALSIAEKMRAWPNRRLAD